MEKYLWNFDRGAELWYNDTHDNIEDCITEAKEALAEEDYQTDEPPTVVYIGENIRYIPSVDVERVLENIEEEAYDQCGEIGGDWDAYDYKNKDELAELEDNMNDVLHAWLKKYGYYPNFWRIENIKEYSLRSVENENS